MKRFLSLLARPLRRGWDRWRSSLLIRVVASSILVGLSSVAMLGAYVMSEIRDGLVDTKVERVLAESARDAATAQANLDSATALTPGDLQQLLLNLVQGLSVSGGQERDVILLQRSGTSATVPLTELTSSEEALEAVSIDMRDAVASGSVQVWQHVALSDSGEPGVVVGEQVHGPAVAGDFELYFVYSLSDEQHTLALIQRVLTLGGVVLVGMLIFMTWSVTLQAVRPVRQAARVARRLADGLLDERMSVSGRDEIATLGRTFNDMAASLQRQITRMGELSRVQRQFVSDVSHELRTPLTTVRMASDVLHSARSSFPPEVARSAELLNAQLDRFESLLSDLLEISRIDAGAAQLDFEDGDLLDVVRAEVRAILPAATRAGVRIRLWAAPGEHTATFDRSRIARIVRNLLANAVEHASNRPVDVLVGSSRRGVAVVVRDYGVGLRHHDVEHVFDRFWRADASRRRTMGGTGLGLAIAREDAQLHGGKLEAWGAPRQGASFRLTLPRTSEGMGSRPVVPLVPHEGDFLELGAPVSLAVATRKGKK